MTKLIQILCLVLLLPVVWADSLSIIELKNRPAEEVIPIVEPMLGPNDAISGESFRIFLRASPDTVTRVRAMIDALDIPAKMLLVSVYQGSDRELDQLGVSGSIQIDTDDVNVDVGDREERNEAAGGSVTYSTTDGSASIESIATQKRLRDNPIHQVRVTEGTEAYIETGERIPYFYGAWVGLRGVAGSVEYKDAITGFYVLPRVRGDNVFLEVSPFKSSRSDSAGNTIDTQSARTTINGRIGEWLFIGGVTEQVERMHSTIGTTVKTRSSDNSGIWIKADLVQ